MGQFLFFTILMAIFVLALSKQTISVQSVILLLSAATPILLIKRKRTALLSIVLVMWKNSAV